MRNPFRKRWYLATHLITGDQKVISNRMPWKPMTTVFIDVTGPYDQKPTITKTKQEFSVLHAKRKLEGTWTEIKNLQPNGNTTLVLKRKEDGKQIIYPNVFLH